MTDGKRRGDPFDGLNGVFALWIVLAAWMTETAGEEPPNGGPLGDPFVSGALSSSLAIDGYL
ncbi:MAG: hypothetical protein AAFU55_14985, partial [Pseudomonadota bacterium]